MNIRPIKKRVVVEPIDDRFSAGGIALIQSLNDKGRRGRVIAVEAGSELKVGDEVLFSQYSGAKVHADQLLILREEDIIGVIEETS